MCYLHPTTLAIAGRRWTSGNFHVPSARSSVIRMRDGVGRRLDEEGSVALALLQVVGGGYKPFLLWGDIPAANFVCRQTGIAHVGYLGKYMCDGRIRVSGWIADGHCGGRSKFTNITAAIVAAGAVTAAIVVVVVATVGAANERLVRI